MALGARQTISAPSITPSYAVPLASETITVQPGTFLHVKNANAAICNVKFIDPGKTPAGTGALNVDIAVPATTGDRMIPVSSFLKSLSTDLVTVEFSVQSSVSVALLTAAS